MNRGFVFDAGELEVDNEERTAPTQSPWEFSGYSAAVKDEHAKRNTTSLDHKISELRSRKERRAVKIRELRDGNKQKKKSSASNAHKQVDSEEEEEEEEEEDSEDEEDEQEEEEEEVENLADRQELESSEEEKGEAEDDNDDEEDEEDEGEEVAGEEIENASSVEDGEALHLENNGVHRREQEDEEEEDDDDDDDDDNSQQVRQAVLIEEADGEASNGQGRGGKKSPKDFFASSEGASFSATSFMDLNISRPLIRACDALGYKQPTPIQAACVPLGLTGRDICGSAVTGSGKTAAFGLPVLERLLYRPRRIPAIRVLILTPTRELAVQVHSMLEKLAQFTDIRSCLVVGGLSSKVQEASLRSRPDIVVATPGRMIDHLHNAHSVGLEELSVLVLDEADRLLELGFTREVHELVRMCPRRRQTMLFSATMTEEVDELIKLSLNKPVRLSADPKTQRPSTLTEEVIKIRPNMEADREAILLALCTRSFSSKVIVFSGTKAEAHRLKIMFGLLGLKAAELHGNLTQAMRLDALEVFRKQEADFLLATDVAARGLDIVGVETVINYECPTNITTYVHRVGRTARAGQQGCAITFLGEKDRPLLKAMAKRGGQKLKNRIVAKAAIEKYRQKIEEMEGDIRTIMQEERDERMLRKAEMEANKAQNLMEHEDEIYSRPKRLWFQSEKEKKMASKEAANAKLGKEKENVTKKVLSVEEAQELKKKEKLKREREKNLPRKKRRRLEAQREEVEDYNEEGEDEDEDEDDEPRAEMKKSKGGKKDGKKGRSVVDIAYRRAKAVKGEERAREAGKLPQKRKERKEKKKAAPKRKEDMEELFENDMSSGKRKKPGSGGGNKLKRKPGVSKHAFKSKARYKRRN